MQCMFWISNESLEWLLSPVLILLRKTDSLCRSVTVSQDSLPVTTVYFHIEQSGDMRFARRTNELTFAKNSQKA